MKNHLDEFRHRRSFLENMNYREASSRLKGFRDWLFSNETIADIVNELWDKKRVKELVDSAVKGKPPKVSTPEDVSMIGLYIIQETSEGKDLWKVADELNIRPAYQTNSVQDYANEAISRFLEPTLDYIENQIEQFIDQKSPLSNFDSIDIGMQTYPLEITNSLRNFLQDHSNVRQTAFIMMKFGTTKAHEEIVNTIKRVLLNYGIVAMRADDKEYHDDLFANVLTYIYGCSFGLAVFERLEADEFNPNVSLEVGYMRALKKPVCLLKDRTMKTLQTDLMGKLYKTFDPQDPNGSIPVELEKWLRDKEIIT